MIRILFCLISIFFLSSCNNSSETKSPKPNIIIINVDDLGWKDLGYMGSEFYHTPTIDELSVALELPEKDVKNNLKNNRRHVSMDAPLPGAEDDDRNMYDLMESEPRNNPESSLLNDSLRREIERSLATLSEREADVIRLYFGLTGKHPMTLEEIGEAFDLTRERVRQIKEKAIRRLRHTSRSKLLKNYLG